MTKEQIVERCVRNIKLALDAGAMYFFDHPMFMQNVEGLKRSCEELFAFSSPLTVRIAPRSLVIADVVLEKQALYVNLAYAFHVKKIKQIVFQKGVGVEELKIFLSHVALPPSDLMQKGGLLTILKDQNITHISVEELDYSEFVSGEGEECADVWAYLLSEAVEKKDLRNVDKVSDQLHKIIRKGKIQQFVKDDKMRGTLKQFFSLLHEKDKEKYRFCAKQLLQSAVNQKQEMSEEDIAALASYVQELNVDDCADTLWEEIVHDDDFDSLSFQLFSQLTDNKKQQAIASSIKAKTQDEGAMLAAPHMRRKVKELFSVTQTTASPYRHLLESILQHGEAVGTIAYDRDHIQENYRYVLIDVLAFEKEPKRLATVLERILKDWEVIEKNENLDYLKKIREALNQRHGDTGGCDEVLADLSARMGQFVERLALAGKIDKKDLEVFTPFMEESSFDMEVYLDRIFKEKKVTHDTLTLLFQLFPDCVEVFKATLKEYMPDMQFIQQLIEKLKGIDPEQAISILEEIYSVADRFTKVKVLQAMQTLSRCDYPFVYSLLRNKDCFLRKEAVGIACNHPDMKLKALEILFSVPNYWGVKGRFVAENLQMIEEFQLREAQPYLEALSEKRLVWNKRLSKYAREILDRWNNASC